MKRLFSILAFAAAVISCTPKHEYISEEDFIKDNLYLNNDEWKGWTIWWHPDNHYYKVSHDIDSVKRSTLIIFEIVDGAPVFIIRNLDRQEAERCTKETIQTSELLKRDYPEISADDLIRRAEWIIKYDIMSLFPKKNGDYDEGLGGNIKYENGTLLLIRRYESLYKEPCDSSLPDSIAIAKWHHSNDIHYHH